MSKNKIEFESLETIHTDNDSKQGKRKETEQSKRFLFLGSALIAVLLILAVIAVSARKKQDAIRASEAAESIAAASRAAEEATNPASTVPAMELCDDPEIEILVHEYFDARMNADSTRIFEIFGRKDTSADDEFEKKLKAQASWIQGFQDIDVYAVNGLSEGEKFCLVRYNIDFRRTDTLAPGVMYFYAEPDGSGSYTFTETMIKDRVDFAEFVMGGESADALIRDTDERLKNALDTDSTLALIYDSFRSGEIYKESELEVDKEQSVDLFMNPEDSILVGDDVLQEIKNEAEHAAEVEASEGENDVYETDTETDPELESGIETEE